MLLNLTNHPSKDWSERQKKAAIEFYGSIHDLFFPQIDPDIDDNDLDIIVDKYTEKVLQLKPSAVHIMGEMTFTFKMVERLKNLGIECLASTTVRRVYEIDNMKVPSFEFVRFRKY